MFKRQHLKLSRIARNFIANSKRKNRINFPNAKIQKKVFSKQFFLKIPSCHSGGLYVN